MNHAVEVKIGGERHYLCYTLGVGKQIAERRGGMSQFMTHISELADAHNDREILEEYMWVFGAMLEAGYWRQVHSGANAPNAPEPPDMQTLTDLFTVGEFEHLVISAIAEGQKREVGVEAPKNAGGPAERPAQNG